MKQQLKRAIPAVGMAMAIGLSTFASAHAQTLPPVKPGEVTGNINTGGSSTVYPLSVELASRFKQDGYKGEIKVDSIGSGAGIQRFCRGEYDVANSSRAMTEAEVTGCKSNGKPIQFQVGIDALTIVVNPKNTWVKSLSKKQLALIFSGAAKTWKDVDSKWPANAIKLFSPGTDSGTFDYFTEHVFIGTDGKVLPNRKDIIPQVNGVNLSENDNVLVAGVEGDLNAIGYFGYAYFEENKRKLRALNFEGIAPNASTVNAGKYGFARPLFVISTGNIMKEKPQVGAFVNYYLGNVDKVIKKVGYFAEPAAKLNQQKQAFLDAIK